MSTNDMRTGSCGDYGEERQGIGRWLAAYERLEGIVPKMPLGLEEALFDSVNLCIDLGSVLDGLGAMEARVLAGKVLGLMAHYRHFFWERRGVSVTIFAYWPGTDVPALACEGVGLLREVLEAIPCTYVVDGAIGEALAFPRWVSRSERFGADTGSPTFVLSRAVEADARDTGALQWPMLHLIGMTGENAFVYTCLERGRKILTEPDDAVIKGQLVDPDSVDRYELEKYIEEWIGLNDIAIGHLFDGIDQWG